MLKITHPEGRCLPVALAARISGKHRYAIVAAHSRVPDRVRGHGSRAVSILSKSGMRSTVCFAASIYKWSAGSGIKTSYLSVPYCGIRNSR